MLVVPKRNNTDGITAMETAMNTNINSRTGELDKIKKCSQALIGKTRTQYVINLDDGVTALKYVKTDLDKLPKNHDAESIVTVTPVRDTKPPTFKGLLPQSGTMMIRSYGNGQNFHTNRQKKHTSNGSGMRKDSTYNGCNEKGIGKGKQNAH